MTVVNDDTGVSDTRVYGYFDYELTGDGAAITLNTKEATIMEIKKMENGSFGLDDNAKEVLYNFRQLMREIQDTEGIGGRALQLSEELESKSYWLETELRSRTHGDDVQEYLWF